MHAVLNLVVNRWLRLRVGGHLKVADVVTRWERAKKFKESFKKHERNILAALFPVTLLKIQIKIFKRMNETKN